jgi:hypothetical protein
MVLAMGIYPPFFVTADSKGVTGAFFVTADDKGLTGFFQRAEKIVECREAERQRRPNHEGNGITETLAGQRPRSSADLLFCFGFTDAPKAKRPPRFPGTGVSLFQVSGGG